MKEASIEAEDSAVSSANTSGLAGQSESEATPSSKEAQQPASADSSTKSLIVKLPINFARLQTLIVSKIEANSEKSSAENQATISKFAGKAVPKRQLQNALPSSPSDDASDNTRKKSLRIKPQVNYNNVTRASTFKNATKRKQFLEEDGEEQPASKKQKVEVSAEHITELTEAQAEYQAALNAKIKEQILRRQREANALT